MPFIRWGSESSIREGTHKCLEPCDCYSRLLQSRFSTTHRLFRSIVGRMPHHLRSHQTRTPQTATTISQYRSGYIGILAYFGSYISQQKGQKDHPGVKEQIVKNDEKLVGCRQGFSRMISIVMFQIGIIVQDEYKETNPDDIKDHDQNAPVYEPQTEQFHIFASLQYLSHGDGRTKE